MADAIRPRYAAATATEKRKILEQFIIATGYHEKSAIRKLNSAPTLKLRRSRHRGSLYDEAVRATLIVLWEASDRVCGKRLKALLPILLHALERNGHLKFDEQLRLKILSMSAATVDRLLRAPRNAKRTKPPKRVEPEPRRRIKMRTFANWNDPAPGSMEMVDHGNRIANRAAAGVPVPLPVAVAPVLAALAALAVGRADQSLHIHLHQPLRDIADHLSQLVAEG